MFHSNRDLWHIPPSMINGVRKHIEEPLASSSKVQVAAVSGVVLVRKKNGYNLDCVYNIALKNRIIIDAYAILKPNDIFDYLYGSKFDIR